MEYKNVTNMSGMFKGCSSLTSFPDISNWNVENVDKDDMFLDCDDSIIPKFKKNEEDKDDDDDDED